jgi:hypothetical protein
VLSPGIKPSWREADHSPPSIAEVNNVRSYMYTEPYVFMAWFLTEQDIRGQFEKFVDWRQCAAVMQREAVIVMPSCSGGANEVVA